MQYPKFDAKMKNQMGTVLDQQGARGTYGIILDYDPTRNMASVLVAHPGSDDAGEAYYNVPCPTTIGVQTVSPLPGRPCWVSFKDNTTWFPIITTFFNHAYSEVDFDNQYAAVNNTPRYIFSM